MKAIQTLLLFFSLTTCYAANTPIEGSIKAGGFHIHYSETGSGEPLVFIHGGMQDRHRSCIQKRCAYVESGMAQPVQ